MTGNFAIFLLGRPAQVGRAPFCSPAPLSRRRALVKAAKLRHCCIRTSDLSGESRFNWTEDQ